MEGIRGRERLRTPERQEWSCTEPLGVFMADWPPPPSCRSGTYFVQVMVDDTRRMDAADAFVVDAFPSPESVLAVMPVPGGAVGYHVGIYGTCWPTDPALRGECAKGGFRA